VSGIGAAWRRFARVRRSERGHTLMEMVVATALLSLVMAAAFGAVNVMSRQSAETTDRFTGQSEA